MAAGARLTKHSAVIGSQSSGTSATSIGSYNQQQWPPDRPDTGLARERVIQAISSKLVPHIHALVRSFSLSTVSDSVVLLRMAIDQLGIFEDEDEHQALL